MSEQGITLDSLVMDAVSTSIEGKLSELTTIILQLSNSNKQFPEYMELGLACEYLSVSRNTLAKYIKDYGLPVVKIEGVKRIAKSDLNEFMLKHVC